MNREGKLENIKSEMERNKINILGISEVRWKDGGDFESDGYRVLYAGEKECQRGVAIILDRTCANKVISVERYGDRIIMVKLQAEPVNMCIVQIYMPTSEHSDEEVEQIYDQIEELIKRQKGTENLLIMGDWNAVVGEGKDGDEVGPFGLGKRNDRGERLVEFCRRNNLMVTNTWFKQENRSSYTWK